MTAGRGGDIGDGREASERCSGERTLRTSVGCVEWGRGKGLESPWYLAWTTWWMMMSFTMTENSEEKQNLEVGGLGRGWETVISIAPSKISKWWCLGWGQIWRLRLRKDTKLGGSLSQSIEVGLIFANLKKSMDLHSNFAYNFREAPGPWSLSVDRWLEALLWMIIEAAGLGETTHGGNRAEDLGTPILKKPAEGREVADWERMAYEVGEGEDSILEDSCFLISIILPILSESHLCWFFKDQALHFLCTPCIWPWRLRW